MTLPTGTPRCGACGAAFSSLRLRAVHRCPALATGLLGPSVLRFELPLPPNLNGSGFGTWRSKDTARKSYWAQCDGLLATGRLPKQPPMAWVRAEATITLRTMHPMDPDNAVTRGKFVLDWAVKRGYLMDDSPEHLTLAAVRQEQGGKAQRGLTLELRRLG